MDTSPHQPAKGASYHPLMILAALAVLLFCLVGTAAIMGWLPSSIGGNAANRPLSDADRAALAAAMPPGSTAAPLAANAAPGQPYAAQPYAGQPRPAETLPPGTYPVQTLAAAPAARPAPVYEPAPRVVHERAAEHVARAEPARDHWCATCGNIESIHEYHTRAQGSGLGAGVGAVLGGLLGNTISRDISCDSQPYAYRTYSSGLNGDIGRRYTWNHGQERGYFVPTREFRRAGSVCRDFTETTYSYGRT